VFPEVFVPGYPYWNWTMTPIQGSPWFEKLFKASILVPGPEIDQVREAATRLGCRYATIDVRDPEQVATLETLAPDATVLVNNAAIQPASSYVRLEDLKTQDFERMLAINFSGYTFMAQHALRAMRKQQCGVVINIASGQAHRTTRGVPVYGPIKAANLLQAMQWGVEYARDGIRVLSVSPGAIDTPLVRATLDAQGGERELANRHPLGRIGKPEEIANAVLWLSSHDASFITGTDLAVDGGLGALGAFAEPYPMNP
jgi:NAD(P)-dependent dehydrogenase (short-subunit alcohol dehydrogenase family)